MTKVLNLQGLFFIYFFSRNDAMHSSTMKLLEQNIETFWGNCYFLDEFLLNVYANSKILIVTVCLEAGGSVSVVLIYQESLNSSRIFMFLKCHTSHVLCTVCVTRGMMATFGLKSSHPYGLP